MNSMTSCGTTCASGVACAPAEVCNAGACGVAQGLAALSIPFTGTGQAQRFAYKFATLPNLTDAKLSVRMFAPLAQSGELTSYPSDADFTAGVGVVVGMSTVASRWTDVVLSMSGASGSFDPSHISQINVEVMAGAAGPWANPTVIYVDRIWSSDGVVNDTFDLTYGAFSSSAIMVLEGSKYEWVETVP